MLYLRQSTASQSDTIGPFVDDTDGKTAETGLSIANTDIRLSKNGGNMAAKNSGGGTHDEAGWYTVTFDATDTDTVGRLKVSVGVSGALPVFAEYTVLEEAVYDALFAASATGLLPANVTQWLGSAPAALTDTDKIQVSVQHMADNVIAAAKIASNAITSAKIAASAIGASQIASNAISATKIASGALTSAKFASGAFDAVWSVATRVLTAGTNIALAKGTGVTGFNDPNVAAIQSGLATASALSTTDGKVDNLVSGIIFGAAATGTLAIGSMTTDLTGYADDQLIGRVVIFLDGACEGEGTPISDYANASGLITFENDLTTAPSDGDNFKIV